MMYSCPKTSTWIALKWMKPRGKWNISKGTCIPVTSSATYWWDISKTLSLGANLKCTLWRFWQHFWFFHKQASAFFVSVACKHKKKKKNVRVDRQRFHGVQLMVDTWHCVLNTTNLDKTRGWVALQRLDVFFFFCLFPAGFAWILPGRLANVFPSTGQTLVWRKLRLLHIEGVSEWLSGHNQYLNCYTNAPHPPPPTHIHTNTHTLPFTLRPPVVLPELLSCCAQITPTLPCFVLVTVWFQHRPIWTRSTCRTEKWNETIQKNHKMLLDIWLIFLACLCAFSLSWAFLLTEKAMVWNYFLISAYL